MKKMKYICLCLGVLVWAGDAVAGQSDLQKIRKKADALAVEFRLRLQAQELMAGLTLFDDVGVLGRGVAQRQPQSDGQNTPGVVTGAEPLVGRNVEDPTDFPANEALSAVTIYLESYHRGFHPLFDLQLEMEAVQQDLKRLQETEMRTQK